VQRSAVQFVGVLVAPFLDLFLWVVMVVVAWLCE